MPCIDCLDIHSIQSNMCFDCCLDSVSRVTTYTQCIACVTGHFVFSSAGGQGSELTNDNFCHYTVLLMKSQL